MFVLTYPISKILSNIFLDKFLISGINAVCVRHRDVRRRDARHRDVRHHDVRHRDVLRDAEHSAVLSDDGDNNTAHNMGAAPEVHNKRRCNSRRTHSHRSRSLHKRNSR